MAQSAHGLDHYGGVSINADDTVCSECECFPQKKNIAEC